MFGQKARVSDLGAIMAILFFISICDQSFDLAVVIFDACKAFPVHYLAQLLGKISLKCHEALDIREKQISSYICLLC